MSQPKILRRIRNRRRYGPVLGEWYSLRCLVIWHRSDGYVVDWDTKDARDAFAETADHANMAVASRHAFGSKPTVNYVEFEDTKGALGAPITEFVTFTLKEGNTIDQLELLVQELHKLLPGTPKFHGDSWAPIIGEPNVYHGILGWDSVQVSVHSDACLG